MTEKPPHLAVRGCSHNELNLSVISRTSGSVTYINTTDIEAILDGAKENLARRVSIPCKLKVAGSGRLAGSTIVRHQKGNTQALAASGNSIYLAVADTFSVQSGGDTVASGLGQADDSQEVIGRGALTRGKEPGTASEVVG